MCNSTTMGKVMDPAKLLTGNSARWADPAGLTKTAVGDPTGQLRRNAETERVRQDVRSGGPERRAAAANYQQQLAAQQQFAAPKTVLGS